MTNYDNTDRGVLFKNDRKASENHPDYKGSINVAGEEFWLSAWIKEGGKGKFMSLSIQPKEAQQRPQSSRGGGPVQRQAPQRRPAQNDSFNDDFADDDIPFISSRSAW